MVNFVKSRKLVNKDEDISLSKVQFQRRLFNITQECFRCLVILNEAQMKEIIDKCYSDHEIRRLLFLCILIGFVAGFVIGFIVRWAVK